MKKIILLVFLVLACSNAGARGTSQAVLINPYFGLGYINPTDINDKITYPTLGIENFVTDASTLKWAKNFGGFLGYRFSQRFNVGLVLDYTSTGKFISKEDTTAFNIYHPSQNGSLTPMTAKYYEFNTSCKAFSIGPALYYTIYNSGKLSLDTGLGVLYAMKVNYFEDMTYGNSSSDPALDQAPNLHQVIGSGSGFGFMFNVTTAYYLTNYMGVGLDFGYRYLKVGTLKDASGNVITFGYPNGGVDNPPKNMTVNFSGVYFGLSLKFDINIEDSAGSTLGEETPSSDANKWSPEAEDKEPVELNTNWDTQPVPATGPTADEMNDLKKQIQRKWNRAKEGKTPDDQKKAERYRKLYDISTKLEKDWGQFTPESRKDKIEKIKTILSR